MRRLLLALTALFVAGVLAGPAAEAAPKYPFRSGARARKAAPKATPKRSAAQPSRKAAEPPSELEEEDEPPPPTRRRVSNASKDDEAEEDPDEEEKPRPQKRSARRNVDEDDDEDAEPEVPIASLPSIIPRTVTVFAGLSVMGRSFATGPALQRESALTRFGPAVALESYPLLSMRGRLKKLGIAAAYSMEFGRAGVQYSNGSTVSFGVRQSRWVVDLRYAFTLGSRVVLIPAVGLGISSYDLQRPMQPMPSACAKTADTLPCLPDSVLTHFKVGVLTRVALTDSIALSIGLNVLPVLNVGKASGQSGAESVDVQSLGYGGELGLTWPLMSWVDLRASIPIVRFGHKFSGPTVMTAYPIGAELYYGTMLGVLAHTM